MCENRYSVQNFITNKPDSCFSKVIGVGMCFQIDSKTNLEAESEVPVGTLITEFETIGDDLLAIITEAQAATIRLRERRQRQDVLQTRNELLAIVTEAQAATTRLRDGRQESEHSQDSDGELLQFVHTISAGDSG